MLDIDGGLGAGIDNGRSSSEGASVLRFESATITENVGTPYGGGFYITRNQPVTIRNTIVAGNTAQSSSADCGGKFTSEGYNLIGSTDGCQIVGDTTGNLTGTDPRLGALADNGGPTRTHAPQELQLATRVVEPFSRPGAP